MHGLILTRFVKFIRATWGIDFQLEVLHEAGLAFMKLDPTRTYDAGDWARILAAGVRHSNLSEDELLGLFGRHALPGLLELYRDRLDANWRTLDIIENLPAIYEHGFGPATLSPPAITVTRDVSRGSLTLEYASPRRMCAFLVGAIGGVAEHFAESFTVVHLRCGREPGGTACVLEIEPVAHNVDARLTPACKTATRDAAEPQAYPRHAVNRT